MLHGDQPLAVMSVNCERGTATARGLYPKHALERFGATEGTPHVRL